jgi:glycine betaine/choline ABC-type transport system substrate-binding protein
VVATPPTSEEGAAFSSALDAVTERLGRRAIRRLNSQVQTHHRRPADVARQFLASFARKESSKRAKRAVRRK